jgi:hypothetical protein
MYDHKYELEHICSYNIRVQMPPEVIGPVAEGLRLNGYQDGGEVTGPRLRGKMRAGGADWATVRTDGVFVMDVRATMETDDGALIYISYNGLMDLGPDGYEKMLGGAVPDDGAPMRITPRFQTAHPQYQWLNRLIFVGVGEIHLSVPEVRYDIYAIR